MKNFFVSLFFLAAIALRAHAQAPDPRTIDTRIADLLAKLPAKDTKQFNTIMEEIGSLGESGIEKMIERLAASSPGSNSKLEYALGGLAFYSTGKGRDNLRTTAVNAFCKSLSKISGPENKAFLLTQLKTAGKDDAVECIKSYLSDERLCDPAARALVEINTPAAKSALLQALPSASGSKQLVLVEALGDAGNKEAVNLITPLTKSEDKNLQKVAYYALAEIAEPASERVLGEVAFKTYPDFNSSNATSAYLLYASNLAATHRERASTIAERLFNDTKHPVSIRIAGLNLLTSLEAKKSTEILLKATVEENSEIRAAALGLAGSRLNAGNEAIWLKALRKSRPQAKADIISMFGNSGRNSALPVILKQLKNKDQNVRRSAVIASGKLGQKEALPALLKLLKKGTGQDVAAVRGALLTMKGDLGAEIARALPNVPPASQAALIEVLGHRAASSQTEKIFPYLKSENPSTREAAYSALKHLAVEDNLSTLFSLLEESTIPKETEEVQKAMSAVIANAPDKKQTEKTVVEKSKQAGPDKQYLYFPVLAAIGNQASLNLVTSGFQSNSSQVKNAALNALAGWKDETALNDLYSVLSSSTDQDFQSRAFAGYVKTVSRSKSAADQKVLLLRRAIDAAKTHDQKRLVIRELANSKTYKSLLLVGNYFEDPQLEQDAAQAVMSIALSDKSFYGAQVSDLLNKTLATLKGTDSDYLKEAIRKHLTEMPKEEGFKRIFNGKDLSGWKGLVENPIKRAKMDSKTLAAAQIKADEEMRKDWAVKNGEIVYVGTGYNNLCTEKKYRDFEMLVDWRIIDDGKKQGDAGIYLRGTPQVQIWDTSRVKDGAQVGSGGLYNNQVHASEPLKVADNAVGEWNNFRIIMKGDRVTVYLNGELVTDKVVLENYWDRTLPIFSEEQLELQAHGSPVAYRDIYIREIPSAKPFQLSPAEKKEGFKVLFDGTNLHEWIGNKEGYVIENGEMVVSTKTANGNLYTQKEYSDFIFRFEFKLTPGGNNGLGIRAPLEGDAAYTGMELQILDNEADIYKDLKPYQYHGSVYGTIPAKRGFLKPVGEWNYQEVIVKGPKIKVILNGTTILDGDITEARKKGTPDGQKHPGLHRDKGHIGFLGHDSEVRFRNIRVKEL